MIENPSKRDSIQECFRFLKCCLYVAADNIRKTRRFLGLFALYARSTIPKFPKKYSFASKSFPIRMASIVCRLRLTHWKTYLSFLVAVVVQTSQANAANIAVAYNPYPLTGEILLLIGLLLHEIGHALVMLCLDVPFDPIIFVPTVGAFVRRTSKPKSIYDEALIAAGGPLTGYIVAAWFGFFGLAFNNNAYSRNIRLLCTFVSTQTWKMNEFNLVPFGIYDGARIVNVISPALSLLFVTYLLATSGVKLDVLSCYHLLMGMRELFFRFWGRRGEEEADMDMNDDDGHTNETYDYLPLSSRITLAFFYIILFLGKSFTAAFVFQSNTFVCGVVATFLAACLLTYVNVIYKAFSSSRNALAFFCVILCLGKSIFDTFALQSNSSDCAAFASFLAALLWTLAGLLFRRHVVSVAKFRSLDVVQFATNDSEMRDSSEPTGWSDRSQRAGLQ